MLFSPSPGAKTWPSRSVSTDSGRIGRLVFRAAQDNPNIEIVGINDLFDNDALAYLLKYDSVHGRFDGTVDSTDTHLIVNGKQIRSTAERDPANLKWGDVGVDYVVECTGFFTDFDGANKHVQAGAKKTIISAPTKTPDQVPTIVMGVNHEKLSADSKVVSNASCTTNCLAPIAKVINDNFGIAKGLMTTVHAVTRDPTDARRPKQKRLPWRSRCRCQLYPRQHRRSQGRRPRAA